MLLTMWSMKGRTADTLYAEWQNLSFDPSKDDIEDFIGDVIQLATQLGYLERPQAVTIRGALPPDKEGVCSLPKYRYHRVHATP